MLHRNKFNCLVYVVSEPQDLSSSYLEYSLEPTAYDHDQMNNDNHGYHGSQNDFKNRLGINNVFNPSLHNQANFPHIQNNRPFASADPNGNHYQNHNQLLIPPSYQSQDVHPRIVTGHTIDVARPGDSVPGNSVNTHKQNFLAQSQLNKQGNLAGVPRPQAPFPAVMSVPGSSYATEFNMKQPPLSLRGAFPSHAYHGIPVLPGSILTHPFWNHHFQNQDVDPNTARSSLKRYKATPPFNTFEIAPSANQPESGDWHSKANDAHGVTQDDGGHQQIQETNEVINREVPQFDDVSNNIHTSPLSPTEITPEHILHGKTVSRDTGVRSLVHGNPLSPTSGGLVSTPGFVDSHPDSISGQVLQSPLSQPAYPEEQLRGKKDIQF